MSGALCVIALVAIATVLTGGEITETSAQVLGSALVLQVYVVLAGPGDSLMRSGESWLWFGAASLLICVLGAGTAIWTIWTLDNASLDGIRVGNDSAFKAASLFLFLAMATAHGSKLVRHVAEREPLEAICRYATLAAALTLSVVLGDAVMIEDEPAIGSEGLAVLGILYALGILLTPLLHTAELRREAPDS